MLHLVKMAAGVRELSQLRARQGGQGGGLVVHRTRNMPKRAAEILDGGSMYWVYSGGVGARQLVEDILEAQYPDGSRCAALVLNPEIVSVEPRKWQAFQGWRYATPEQVPKDLGTTEEGAGLADMQERLRRELRELGLV
jgi:hypothetical protein